MKFKFLFNKFNTDLAYLASFAAVVCGALRDDIKRIKDKGASYSARLSAFKPVNGRTYKWPTEEGKRLLRSNNLKV